VSSLSKSDRTSQIEPKDRKCCHDVFVVHQSADICFFIDRRPSIYIYYQILIQELKVTHHRFSGSQQIVLARKRSYEVEKRLSAIEIQYQRLILTIADLQVVVFRALYV
jgi:hypothetical protein